MTKAKTVKNNASVEDFLNAVVKEKKRADSLAILDLMKEATGEEPEMWGPSIVGFGSYHYVYASGHEGDKGRLSELAFGGSIVSATLLALAFANRRSLLGWVPKSNSNNCSWYN